VEPVGPNEATKLKAAMEQIAEEVRRRLPPQDTADAPQARRWVHAGELFIWGMAFTGVALLLLPFMLDLTWFASPAHAWAAGFVCEATCLYGLARLTELAESLQDHNRDHDDWSRQSRISEARAQSAGYSAAVTLCFLAAGVSPASWFGSSLTWAWVSGVVCGFTVTGGLMGWMSDLSDWHPESNTAKPSERSFTGRLRRILPGIAKGTGWWRLSIVSGLISVGAWHGFLAMIWLTDSSPYDRDTIGTIALLSFGAFFVPWLCVQLVGWALEGFKEVER